MSTRLQILKMKCILNRDIPSCVSEYFKSKNFKIIYTNLSGAVSDSVGLHPDIQCAVIKNKFITSKKHYEYYKSFIDNITVSEKELSSPYPFDVLFNCFILGDTVYGNEKYLDNSVKKIIFENNLKICNVNQGYTNCSTLKITDNAVITSDEGMKKAFLKNNIDVLFTDNKTIKLKVHKNGFIGGAACHISDEAVFFGDITAHPDFIKISEFLKKYNVNYKTFSFPLEDFGSALFLE